MRPSELNLTHGTARINGATMHYHELGSGRLLLLLHGFPETHWAWRHQFAPLARAGYRVVAPDLRGYSNNEKRGPYDADTLAEDVRQWIAHFGESKALVAGHDWGGVIAWQFAANHPSWCERLVVINAPHPEMFAQALRNSPAQRARSRYILKFLVPFYGERWVSDPESLPWIYSRVALLRANFSAEEIAPFQEGFRVPGAALAAVSYYRTLMWGVLTGRTSKTKVEAPTLLICSKWDQTLEYGAVVSGTERYVPDLEIKVLRRAGHYSPAESPEEMNACLLEFLARSR